SSSPSLLPQIEDQSQTDESNGKSSRHAGIKPIAFCGKAKMSREQSHQGHGQNRIGRNVHVEIGEGMNQDGDQTNRCPENEGGPVAEPGFDVIGLPANISPSLEDTQGEQDPAASHEDC